MVIFRNLEHVQIDKLASMELSKSSLLLDLGLSFNSSPCDVLVNDMVKSPILSIPLAKTHIVSSFAENDNLSKLPRNEEVDPILIAPRLGSPIKSSDGFPLNAKSLSRENSDILKNSNRNVVAKMPKSCRLKTLTQTSISSSVSSS